MIRFNDGVSFDTSGPPRVTRRRDGVYVVGGGMLVPCDSVEEANALVKEMTTVKAAAKVGYTTTMATDKFTYRVPLTKLEAAYEAAHNVMKALQAIRDYEKSHGFDPDEVVMGVMERARALLTDVSVLSDAYKCMADNEALAAKK